jgi:hypothetical protein
MIFNHGQAARTRGRNTPPLHDAGFGGRFHALFNVPLAGSPFAGACGLTSPRPSGTEGRRQDCLTIVISRKLIHTLLFAHFVLNFRDRLPAIR